MPIFKNSGKGGRIMNKILILSDNHGLTDELVEIKKRHEVDYFIHCGDSELDMDAPELEDFIKVAGNCDHDVRFPEEQIIEVGDLRVLIVHGHLHGVKRDLTTLSYRAEELGAQLVCYGHTHVANAKQLHNQLFINPGSIRLPRLRPEKTYCILGWENINQINITFYTLGGKVVNDLSYTASLK